MGPRVRALGSGLLALGVFGACRGLPDYTFYDDAAGSPSSADARAADAAEPEVGTREAEAAMDGGPDPDAPVDADTDGPGGGACPSAPPPPASTCCGVIPCAGDCVTACADCEARCSPAEICCARRGNVTCKKTTGFVCN